MVKCIKGGFGKAMKKVFVVFTGGTISCKKDTAVMSAGTDIPYYLLNRYKEELGDGATFAFDTASPLTILSENLLPDDWKTMADCIRKRFTADYSGIIITHGTDTLAYTACAMAFMLAGLPVPVVLVSSNYPPQDERSNAYANFKAALDFIGDAGLPGVYTLFEQDGRMQVFLGSRLVQARPYTDSFSSVTGVPLGIMCGGRFCRTEHADNPSVEQLKQAPIHTLKVFPALRSCVQYIRPYPGIDYSRLSMPTSVRAVYHGLYHSGTACVRLEEAGSSGGNTSLVSFAKACGEAGLPVYISPIWKDKAVYASVQAMYGGGLEVLPPMSEEAAFVKLLLAYNLYAEQPEQRDAFLKEEQAFEYLHF